VSLSKFTPEARAEVVGYVGAGASIPDAARAAGVGVDTLKRWLARGRREDLGPYSDFEAAVADARKQARLAPDPMSPSEFREHLERAVRAGSVQAMKLWADQFLIPPELAPGLPPSAIARLVQRRANPGSGDAA
jgi:transposase-like protein